MEAIWASSYAMKFEIFSKSLDEDQSLITLKAASLNVCPKIMATMKNK
jgi:hypothetical protein